MSCEITVTYEGNMCAVGEKVGGDSSVVMDASAGCGRGGSGMTPLDILAVSYAGCVIMSMDVIAKKNGLDIAGAKVSVALNVDGCCGRRIRGIDAKVILPRQYTAEQLELLRKGETYCPVHNALGPDIKTSLEFETA